MRDETQIRAHLRAMLEPAFETFEEVEVRHALFRRRRMRVDLLAIPRDPTLSDIALAFETKGDRVWDIPLWAQALKQASDYVLATVEPKLSNHSGKRVMATFVYPAPQWVLEMNENIHSETPKSSFLSGMAHMAGYHRVGMARYCASYGRQTALTLSIGPNEVWLSTRGWRAQARHLLAGKRQIGSQRFPILDELANLP